MVESPTASLVRTYRFICTVPGHEEVGTLVVD